MEEYDTSGRSGQRAYRLLYGLPDLRRRPDNDLQPVEKMIFHPWAVAVLRGHMNSPGRVHSGPLYGHRDGPTLEITHAGRAAAPSLHAAPGVAEVDPQYVLGSAHALATDGRRPVDWVAHWVVPNARPLVDPLIWLEQAQALGYADHEHPLLILGTDHVNVTWTAYVDPEGPNDIEVELRTGRPSTESGS